MISPVSFNGVFVASTKPGIRTRYLGAYILKDINRERNFREFRDYANCVAKIHSDAKVKYDFKSDDKAPLFHRGTISITVPNDMDKTVKDYLDYTGINYKYIKNPD